MKIIFLILFAATAVSSEIQLSYKTHFDTSYEEISTYLYRSPKYSELLRQLNPHLSRTKVLSGSTVYYIPEKYVVKRDDQLALIAYFLTGSTRNLRRVLRYNPQIENPNKISVGDAFSMTRRPSKRTLEHRYQRLSEWRKKLGLRNDFDDQSQIYSPTQKSNSSFRELFKNPKYRNTKNLYSVYPNAKRGLTEGIKAAQIELSSGNHITAEEIVNFLAESYSRYPEAHFYKGDYYLQMKDYKRSESAFNKALQLDPYHIASHAGLIANFIQSEQSLMAETQALLLKEEVNDASVIPVRKSNFKAVAQSELMSFNRSQSLTWGRPLVEMDYDKHIAGVEIPVYSVYGSQVFVERSNKRFLVPPQKESRIVFESTMTTDQIDLVAVNTRGELEKIRLGIRLQMPSASQHLVSK